MTLTELFDEIHKLPCDEKRERYDDYLEVVVTKANLPLFTELLNACFGEPAKPEGRKPSRDQKRLAESYGGIWPNQTLYFREKDSAREVAMLWPWSCGTMVTVKIGRRR